MRDRRARRGAGPEETVRHGFRVQRLRAALGAQAAAGEPSRRRPHQRQRDERRLEPAGFLVAPSRMCGGYPAQTHPARPSIAAKVAPALASRGKRTTNRAPPPGRSVTSTLP